MAERDYWDMFPDKNETLENYCSRLESDGFEEMYIRKALRCHYGLPLKGLAVFFENYPHARLWHIALLRELHPNRTPYSLRRKIARNLGISDERAEHWVGMFEAANPEDFIKATYDSN